MALLITQWYVTREIWHERQSSTTQVKECKAMSPKSVRYSILIITCPSLVTHIHFIILLMRSWIMMKYILWWPFVLDRRVNIAYISSITTYQTMWTETLIQPCSSVSSRQVFLQRVSSAFISKIYDKPYNSKTLRVDDPAFWIFAEVNKEFEKILQSNNCNIWLYNQSLSARQYKISIKAFRYSWSNHLIFVILYDVQHVIAGIIFW